MSSRYFILLDIGGTDLKLAIVEAGSTILENISRMATPPFIEQLDTKREVDPLALVRSCNDLLIELLGTRDNFCGLLISGQMGGWILSDVRNQPITNLVSWQDLRSEQITPHGRTILEVAKQLYGAEWLLETGNEMRGGLPAVGLFEYFETHPSVCVANVRPGHGKPSLLIYEYGLQWRKRRRVRGEGGGGGRGREGGGGRNHQTRYRVSNIDKVESAL